MKHLIVALLFWVITVSVNAQNGGNPLWQNTPLNAFPVEVIGEGTPAEVTPAEPSLMTLDSSPMAFSASAMSSVDLPPEIVELADSLVAAADANPIPGQSTDARRAIEVFNWVRNNINYQSYHGLRKGSLLTLLEGSGNDFDQCALLADLLSAAGMANFEFRLRGMKLNYDDVSDWLGMADEPFPGRTFEEVYGVPVEEFYAGAPGVPPEALATTSNLVAKQAAFGSAFIASSGIAMGSNTVSLWSPYLPQRATFVFDHLWLRLTIDQGTFNLDPSYKIHDTIPGLQDLLSASGYTRSALLSAVGGNAGPRYVRNLSDSGIEAHLASRAGALLDLLEQNYPNLSLNEIVSGRRIVEVTIDDLSEAFVLPEDYFGTNLTWTEIPSNYRATLRIRSGSLDYTFDMAELRGRKLSLTFSGTQAQLRVDDVIPPAETGRQPTGAVNTSFNLTISANVPGPASNLSETKDYQRADNFVYTIIYGFSPSGRLLQRRNECLQDLLESGLDDDSHQVRSELLNVMGLTWLYQTNLVDRLLASQNDVALRPQYRFGRVGQEQGFYIDVGLQLAAHQPRDGVTDGGQFDNVFHLGALFASALEHGIIEQMQPGYSAVSTVNILRQANRDSVSNSNQRLYLADSTNWNVGTHKVRGNLQNYPNLTDLDDAIANGATLFLPRNYNVSQGGIWNGSGWIIRSPSRAGMIISGGYSGGFSTSPGYVSSPTIVNSSFSNPTYNYTSPSSPGLQNFSPPSYSTPDFYGSDPVDMATGSFTYANTDLSTGNAGAPRGLTLTRSYRSLTAGRDTQHLGYGWTHNLHIRAYARTATEEALGLGTPQQAATFLTSALIASDLYREGATPTEWGAAVLTVGWFTDELAEFNDTTDQLETNAVSITIGHDTFQFIRQPNGTFTPPTGSTMSLSADGNGNYVLRQRLGNTIFFEPTQTSGDNGQRVDRIVDVDGVAMQFEYHADDRLNYVQDAFGRRFTFHYDGNDRINRVQDSAGRNIYYRYDANGNLDRFTDPETRYTYFAYAVNGNGSDSISGSSLPGPVDPSGITAIQHLMVRMRNHDGQIITQNVYDDLERVAQQYLHGDTNKTWTLNYTGVSSLEIDPAGNVTEYQYDERGRSAGQIDAMRDASFWEYDGQDHVVRQVSPSGEVTVNHYDGDHNLLRSDHPRGGGSTVYTYDALHRIQTVTDPDGNVTTYTYFINGPNAGKNRPQTVVDSEGTTTFTYYASGTGIGRVNTVSDDDGLVTTYTYDQWGQPNTVTEPGNFVTDYNYNARGDLLSVIDPRSIRTTFTYNARRQVIRTEYDDGGADEAAEDRSYDNQGRLASITHPTDNSGQRVVERFTYTPTDKPLGEFLANETATLADDAIATYAYDGRDFNTAVTDALGRVTSLNYFPDGELQATDRPEATGDRDTAFTYDGDGRLLSQTDPGAGIPRSTGFAYDVTDIAEGDQTTGFPRTVFTAPDGLTTTSEYDRRGNLRYFTNRSDKVFALQYDGLGRQTSVATPLDVAAERALTTTYTHRGAPLTVTEPSGEVTSFNYHPTSGRLTSVTDDVGTISYTYNANGDPLTVTEGSDTITRTYDRLGRVLSYTDENGQAIGYRYYDSGRLRLLIYPGGNETTGNVEYTYWQTGRLKNVIERLGNSPRTSTFYWSNDGRLARIERPNGTKRVITYDDVGRPELIQELHSDDTIIASYDVSYYDSDEIYQLAVSPSIDPAQFDAPPPVALTFNADNQIATFEIPGLGGTPPGHGMEAAQHDLDGNMSWGPLPSGQMASYNYNARNQLTSAGGINYQYDAEGNRIGISGTTNASFVIDANRGLSRPIQITRNGVTTRYVYGIGLSYEVDASGNAIYYHYDQTGNTVALTNQSQTVVAEYRYAPYGHLIYQSGSHQTPFRYGGFFAIHTDDNGLIHMRARYFNSLICRFVNSDPAQDGWNWYAYANGNPIMNIDPTGFGSQNSIQAMTAGYSFALGSGSSSYTAKDFARDVAGFVPVLGSALDAYDSFAAGNWGQGILHTALAITDLTGVGAITKGLVVGGFKIAARQAVKRTFRSGLSSSWDNVSARIGRNGLRDFPKQEIHHWLFNRNQGIGRLVPDRIKNQPWNLMRMPQDTAFHDALHGGGELIWANRSLIRAWNGTPGWAKIGVLGVGSYSTGLFYN